MSNGYNQARNEFFGGGPPVTTIQESPATELRFSNVPTTSPSIVDPSIFTESISTPSFQDFSRPFVEERPFDFRTTRNGQTFSDVSRDTVDTGGERSKDKPVLVGIFEALFGALAAIFGIKEQEKTRREALRLQAESDTLGSRGLPYQNPSVIRERETFVLPGGGSSPAPGGQTAEASILPRFPIQGNGKQVAIAGGVLLLGYLLYRALRR